MMIVAAVRGTVSRRREAVAVHALHQACRRSTFFPLDKLLLLALFPMAVVSLSVAAL